MFFFSDNHFKYFSLCDMLVGIIVSLCICDTMDETVTDSHDDETLVRRICYIEITIGDKFTIIIITLYRYRFV